jgi:hypothetical protein
MRRLASLLAALALGCAANPYDDYKAEHPDWSGEGPSQGASLAETIAVLYAPPIRDNQRTVAKLDVLRFENGKARLLSKAEVDAARASDAPGDYGMVATLSCRGRSDTQMFIGQKVSWYLFPGNRLSAFDHFDFVEACTVFNEFHPARGDEQALERQLIAHRDANFPRSMEHAAEFYRKGVAYLAADRTEDARAMLAAGDRTLDVGARGEKILDYENAPPQLAPVRSPEIAAIRNRLVQGLEARPESGP